MMLKDRFLKILQDNVPAYSGKSELADLLCEAVIDYVLAIALMQVAEENK